MVKHDARSRKASCCVANAFDQIKVNLDEIQLKKHQNVQKSDFLQKVPSVNGLNSLKKGITSAVECADQTVFTFAKAMVQVIQFVLIE